MIFVIRMGGIFHKILIFGCVLLIRGRAGPMDRVFR